MRGTVAKRIRKRIYGDASLKAKRRYVKETVTKEIQRYPKVYTVNRDTIKNVGLRQEYQDAKKDYYAERR